MHEWKYLVSENFKKVNNRLEENRRVVFKNTDLKISLKFEKNM